MPELNHAQLWRKLKQIRCIEGLMRRGLLLYALIIDGDVPVAAKALAVAALAYLVNPFDAIPDLTPLAGYADDLVVVIAAITKLGSSLKLNHHSHAQQMLDNL